MQHQTTLNYNESLIRETVFAFWRKSFGPIFFITLIAVSFGLAVLVQRGDRSWLVGALATSLALVIAFLIGIYVVHYRNSLNKFHRMGRPQATFLVEDASFTLTSGIGSSTMEWSIVKEVWRFPSFWLLLFSKAQFVTLPLADMSREMQEFTLQKIRSAGGKVTR